jgi:aryl-alcohol dehydrogenase-like predicted oxidoreductase
MGWGSAKDEASKVYDAFRAAGGNFIDTANFYINGTSEPFLGEFMKDHRQSVVLATKCTMSAPGRGARVPLRLGDCGSLESLDSFVTLGRSRRQVRRRELPWK